MIKKSFIISANAEWKTIKISKILYTNRSFYSYFWINNSFLKRYKCFINQHEKLLHNDIQYLLIMTFANEILYDIKLLKNLWNINISDDDDALLFRWKNEIIELLIVRNVIKTYDVTNASLSKTIFKRIFKSILNLSKYFNIATIYAIRRVLNKKLDDK